MEEKKGTQQNASELRRILPLSSLVFYGLAFMIPLTFCTTYGLVTNMTHGMVSLTYVITTLCMSFTAFSYVHMTKAYPVAGSVYTFVHKSINPYLGFMAGWLVLIGYMFLPMLNYIAAAIFLNAAVPQIPIWCWIVVFIVIVTAVNHLGIKVTDIFNKTIVWFQIVFLAALIVLVIKFVLGGGGVGTFFSPESFINLTELNQDGMGFGVLLGGASLLALSFLGFDAISTLSEEAINPERNVGKAILITCIGAGIFFAIITYMLQAAWPTAWYEIVDIDGGAYEVINKVAGSVMAYLFTIAFSVGAVASAISSVASASRVLYGMGRDRILPKGIFGYLHPKRNTPTYSINIMAAISLLALVIPLATATSLLNFGALLSFTLVNLSVIGHYFVKGGRRKGFDAFRYLIAPIIGAVFTFMIWISLDKNSMILGFAWFAIGVVYLAFATKFFNKLPVEMNLEGSSN